MTVAGPRTSLTANDDASARRVLNQLCISSNLPEMDSTNGSWIRIAIAAVRFLTISIIEQRAPKNWSKSRTFLRPLTGK
jgi:hypothetical protein